MLEPLIQVCQVDKTFGQISFQFCGYLAISAKVFKFSCFSQYLVFLFLLAIFCFKTIFFFRQFWPVINFSRSYSEAEKLNGKGKVFRCKTKKTLFLYHIQEVPPMWGVENPDLPLFPSRSLNTCYSPLPPPPLHEHEQV